MSATAPVQFSNFLDNFAEFPSFFDGILLALAFSKRYADRDIPLLQDGTSQQFTGHLLSQNTVIHRIATEFQQVFQDDYCEIALSDQKDLDDGSRISSVFQGSTTGSNRSGAEVQVLLGSPTDDVNDMKMLFEGIVDSTDLAEVGEEDLKLRLVSMVKKLGGEFMRVFTRENYPLIDDALIGQVIPYVFGDWQTDVGSLYPIPAYYVGNGNFKIADHEIAEVGAAIVVRDGKYQPFGFTADLENGELKLSNYHRRQGDQVFVKCKGYRAGDVTVADTPANVALVIIRDIMEFFDIQFLNWDQFDGYTKHLKVRRWIGDKILAEDLLQSLVDEVGAHLAMRYDYTQLEPTGIRIEPYVANFARLQNEVDQTNQYEDYDNIGSFTEVLDPLRLYANKIEWTAGIDPSGRVWTSGEIEDTSETSLSNIKERSLQRNYQWIYRTGDAHALASRELYRRIIRVADKAGGY